MLLKKTRPFWARQLAERQLPSGGHTCPSSNAYLCCSSPTSLHRRCQGQGHCFACAGITESLVEAASLALLKGLKESGSAAAEQSPRLSSCSVTPQPPPVQGHPSRRDPTPGKRRSLLRTEGAWSTSSIPSLSFSLAAPPRSLPLPPRPAVVPGGRAPRAGAMALRDRKSVV